MFVVGGGGCGWSGGLFMGLPPGWRVFESHLRLLELANELVLILAKSPICMIFS